MWEISNSLQLIAFLRSVLLGVGFCFGYDILRALRRVGFNSDLEVFIGDILYFIIFSPITFCFLLVLTGGELRAYFFIGVLSGYLLTRFTLSRLFFKILVLLLNCILRFLKLIKRLFNSIFERIFKIFNKIYAFLRKIAVKFIIYFKKLLKKR